MDLTNTEFVKFAIQQGGVTLVAIFAVWQLTQLQKQFGGLLTRVLDVLDKNTAALASLTSATEHVGDVVASCGVNRRHGDK